MSPTVCSSSGSTFQHILKPSRGLDSWPLTLSTVRRSGSGGAGEVVRDAKRRTVPNFKYRPGGNAPKTITLPLGEPAPGTDGAHVVLFVDPALDTLLHLHGTGRKVLAHRSCRRHASLWVASCKYAFGQPIWNTATFQSLQDAAFGDCTIMAMKPAMGPRWESTCAVGCVKHASAEKRL